ncbi:MAG: GNAT family N-acetyltransferase [Hyphomicrobiales bacterium]
MNVLIRELTLADYDQVMNLWTTCEGIGLSSADTQQAVGSYLERNPHLSRVAEEAGRVAAAVLCGHDGRRGYLYHLAVRPVSRGRGIGRRLVQTCLVALQADGIQKCHAFVFRDNLQGVDFWRHLGWTPRADIGVVSIDMRSC